MSGFTPLSLSKILGLGAKSDIDVADERINA